MEDDRWRMSGGGGWNDGEAETMCVRQWGGSRLLKRWTLSEDETVVVAAEDRRSEVERWKQRTWGRRSPVVGGTRSPVVEGTRLSAYCSWSGRSTVERKIKEDLKFWILGKLVESVSQCCLTFTLLLNVLISWAILYRYFIFMIGFWFSVFVVQ